MNIDLNFYPGWVRKCITFTIDDGNVVLDRKFMNYVKPAGIKGTFNLSTPLSRATPDEYRALYRGYGISNHCYHHAYAFSDGREYKFAGEMYNRETADKALIYNTDEEGIYRNYSYAWTYIADDERYIECVDKAQAEIEEVFGKGNVKGYVWPCGEQNNAHVFEMMCQKGFDGLRITGNVKDSTNFSLPADRNRWSYNANNTCLCEVAEAYEKCPDDGNLKFFCFGVHSHDFENAGNWYVLEDFCNKYGNRPEDFWYTDVSSIFEYEDAVKAVKVTENSVFNPSDIDLYIKIDGKRVTLGAGETVTAG